MSKVDWIKLNVDMFSNPKIKYIRTLPDGNDILLTWIMLLTTAGRCNDHGYIYLTEDVPYDAEMLSAEFGIPVNTIKLSIMTFEKLKMIEHDEYGLCITGWEEHQNADKLETIKEYNRLRKREQREKQKQLKQSQNNTKALLTPSKDDTNSECQEKCPGHVKDGQIDNEQFVQECQDTEVDIEIDITTTNTTIGDTEVKTPIYTYENVKEIYSMLIQGGAANLLAPRFVEDLNFFIEKLGHEVVIYGIQEASAAGTLKSNHNYLHSILMSWTEKGLNTIDKVIQEKQLHDALKNLKPKDTQGNKPNYNKKHSSFNIEAADNEYMERNRANIEELLKQSRL